MSTERLDKILSHNGFGTRKDVKHLLRKQTVLVNGQVILDPGFHTDPDKDSIVVDGEEIAVSKNVYLMMNKPQDVVCANKDGLHATVFSLLDPVYQTGWNLENLHLIGRLDIDTEGLLIFTTDGKLTHKIISPKSGCSKKYYVGLESSLSEEDKKSYTDKLKAGIHIGPEGNEPEADCLPAFIEFTDQADKVFLTITEGKYHQVKRMFSALGNKVVYLKRVSMSGLKLDESLKTGEYRYLTPEEVQQLSCF